MATQTPNYSFQKPTVSGDSGVWGGYLNDNFTSLDNLLGGNTVITGIDINSGSIDGTAIGANAVSTGAFSTVTVDNITIDGQQITSTNTNGNIQLFANGTGYVELYGNTNPGAVRFNCENNSHGVTLKGPAHSAGATYSLELPDADGSAGTFLTTDGSGKLSFGSSGAGSVTSVALSGGSTGLTVSGSPITGSGTITIAGTLAVANGGTGVTTSTGTGAAVLGTSPTITGMTLAGAVVGADQTVSAINLKDYGEITNALGNVAGATTIDLTLGNSVTATTTSAVTWTFSNPTASDELCGFSLKLVNGGSATQTWPTSVDWPAATAPTLTTSGTDVLVFTICDGGTTWYGFVAGLALA